MGKTVSFKTKYAQVTDIGNSNEETILPKPKPVFGKPAFKNSGGRIVPNNAKGIP